MHESERARRFGEWADEYDRLRPSYPPEVIELVVQSSPRLAIDVGCGTGIAAALVATRGVEVRGVEPDPRMAAVASGRGITVDVTTIEEWTPVSCDVMYAAQSWHWVQPDRGAVIAADAVETDGRWLAIWNYESGERLERARNDAYRRLAPHLVDTIPSPDNDDVFVDPIRRGFAATGAFEEFEVVDLDWVEATTVRAVVQRLATHSTHRQLGTDLADAVDAALEGLLGDPDEPFDLEYRTRVISARRR